MIAAGLPLADWLTRLESLSAHEIDMGLERVEQVLQRLDLEIPDTVFHIAGTNGKGSCVAMLEALLRTTGARVGCYTSPHVHRYNERIRVEGQEAEDTAIIAAFERIEAVRENVPLTYFEFGTIAALVVFADADLDVAILEVGMGGRLDAVNAVEPDAGLITNVSLDHCDWLGNDVESIGFEKAGIMRPDKPVVFGSREVPRSVIEHADSIGAPFVLAGKDYDWSSEGGSWSWRSAGRTLSGLERPALQGEHQIVNAAAVLALLEAAGYEAALTESLVSPALAEVSLDGRMQRVTAGARWIFDAAHNPAAASALADVLRRCDKHSRTIAILGLLNDKDVEGVVTPLLGLVDDWVAVTADSARAVPAGKLARRIADLANAGCLAAESLRQAIDHVQALATAEDRVLVTGSFYLVGPVLSDIYSPRRS
jgi:dihydrofolate synthase/folylpolyglutamate synthase